MLIVIILFLIRSYKFGIEPRRAKREISDFENNPNAYITAQISKFNFTGEFTIGDGKTYGQYKNSPLEKDMEYNVYVGASSGFDEVFDCHFIIVKNKQTKNKQTNNQRTKTKTKQNKYLHILQFPNFTVHHIIISNFIPISYIKSKA